MHQPDPEKEYSDEEQREYEERRDEVASQIMDYILPLEALVNEAVELDLLTPMLKNKLSEVLWEINIRL